GEPALVLRDQARLERPLAIARDVDRERPVVGQDLFAARAVAMIRRVVGFRPAWRVTEMVCELATERALDNRFLEATHGGVELLGRDRALAEKVGQDLARHRCEGAVRRKAFPSAAHRLSSCYAPHTKLRTPSRRKSRRPDSAS